MECTGSNPLQLNIAESEITNFGPVDHSVVLWFKTTNTDGVLVSKAQSTWGTKGKRFFIKDRVLAVDGYQLDTHKGSTVVNDGLWHHAVYVFESASKTYSIYLDGALDGSGVLDIPIDHLQAYVLVGTAGSGSDIGPFIGNVKDVWHYDRKLLPEEILEMSQTYGSRITMVQDEQSISPSFIFGKNWMNTGKTDFSFDAWIKLNDNEDVDLITRMSTSKTFEAGSKTWYINNGEKLMFKKYGGNKIDASGGSSLSNNEWHYIVFTQEIVDRTNAIWKLYIDGQMEDSANRCPKEDKTLHVFHIGEDSSVDGKIKLVHYYPYTLSQEQVGFWYTNPDYQPTTVESPTTEMPTEQPPTTENTCSDTSSCGLCNNRQKYYFQLKSMQHRHLGNHSVIASQGVPKQSACAILCMQTNPCITYNIARSVNKNSNLFNCELFSDNATVDTMVQNNNYDCFYKVLL